MNLNDVAEAHQDITKERTFVLHKLYYTVYFSFPEVMMIFHIESFLHRDFVLLFAVTAQLKVWAQREW